MLYWRGMSTSPKQLLQSILDQADIKIDGSRPWDIQVHNDAFYTRLLNQGTLGAGESYMAKEWDCDQLDVLIDKLLRANLAPKLKANREVILGVIKAKLTNIGRRSQSMKIAQQHYDLGNDVYEATLDKLMQYTCAYWKNAKNINEAQEAKLDLICRKLGLKKGMRLLDIGGGWGGLAKYAAEKYGVEVVNISISKKQISYANKLCKGLPVENRFQDYRDVNEKFDRITSICMIEHVGYKNYATFMDVVHRNLKDDGLFLLQTIGGNKSLVTGDPWILKYIFPNSMLSSIEQLGRSIQGRLIMEDWHNFGAHYDKTLMAWYKNFETNWPKLEKKYGEEFYRMWRFYLLTCAGSFRARNLQLWQIVFSKNGIPGGYESIR